MKSFIKSGINILGLKVQFDLFMAKWRSENVVNVKNKLILQNFFSKLIRPGMLCFDIGANIGSYSEAFLLNGATVVAAEPQPYCAQYLKGRFKNNHSFILEKVALGEKAGFTEMFLNESHTISSLSSAWIHNVTMTNRYNNSQWNKSIQVQVTTLDELIKKYGRPYFCKIDVEGYELNVCKGLTSSIPFLSFEFSPEMLQNSLEIIDHLNTLGKAKFFWHDAFMDFNNSIEWISDAEFKNVLIKKAEEGIPADFYVRFFNSHTEP